MKITIAGLDTKALEKDCSKVYSLLEKFIRAGIMKDLEASPMEPEQIVDTVNQLTKNGVAFHYRILLDFFDSEKMFIVIDCADYQEGKEWYPIVNNVELAVTENRQEAEINAILEAFAALEEELTSRANKHA